MAPLNPSWTTRVLMLVALATNIVKCNQCVLITPAGENYRHCSLYHNFNLELICENYVEYTKYYCYEYIDEHRAEREESNPFYYKIIVKQPREHNLIKVDLYDSITSLTLGDGSLTALPDNVNKMDRLKYIAITGNKINTFDSNTFFKLGYLMHINLTNNMISHINEEPHSHGHSYVSKIDISSNYIEILPDGILKGYEELQYLNISHNKVYNIGLLAFTGLEQLQILDISYNNLDIISDGAFKSTKNLQQLYISNNKLTNINAIDFVALSNLKRLDISKNSICIIEPNAFINHVNLEDLDLGYNKLKHISNKLFNDSVKFHTVSLSDNQIELIEDNTFTAEQFNLLNLQNNYLSGSIIKKILNGMNITELNLSGNNITFIDNFAFANISNTKSLNLSFNALELIHFSALSPLVMIEVLDLSHNQLKELSFDTSALAQLTTFNAHHNSIERINSTFFDKLIALQKIDLSYNNIKNIEALSFLSTFNYLDLSSNNHIKITDYPFQNITYLHRLSLQKVKIDFTFETASISIETLDLQSCGISDINKLFVTNVQNIVNLNLSMNEITTVDKNSFKNMSLLRNLDLSLNKVNFIQPGSFLLLNNLRILNLHGNNLSHLQLGVFYGPQALEELNLSNNMLNTFDAELLPTTAKLYLDNNLIYNINLPKLLEMGISELSLGNKFSCKVIADLQKSKHSDMLDRIKSTTTYSENVNGIPCSSIEIDSADDSSTNNNNILSLFASTLEKINLAIQNIDERTKQTEKLIETLTAIRT